MAEVSSLNSKHLISQSLTILLLIELVIVIFDLYQHHTSDLPTQLRRMFNITREDSIGTWFASTQTFVVAIILWINFIRVRSERPRPNYKTLGAWGITAGFFTYASIDDGARLHEGIGTVVSNAPIFDLFPSYPWQVVFVPLFVVIGIVMLYIILRKMDVRLARTAVFMGLLLSGVGAVGIDFIEGIPEYSDFEFADFLSDDNPTVRHYFKVIEEFIEMLGMSLFLVGFGTHIMRRYPEWKIRFT